MLKQVQEFAQSFAHDEQGATAIEYGLIAGIISIAIVAGATLTSDSLDVTFTNVSDGFTTALG